MIERRRIVEKACQGQVTALATLVHVEGSSYRKRGARLLIGTDGSIVGAISGGCLEGEIVRKAAWLTRTGAVVERYSTLFDDTAEIPYGLGCGGTVEVLIEPAATPEFNALVDALAASLQGERPRIVTWLPQPGRPLAREIHDEHGAVLFRSSHAPPSTTEARSFREQLDPPQRLFVFGAGDDAQPMVRLAALLGWRVFVADGRAQWARPARFPEAESVLAANTLGAVRPQAFDAVVLMTHSYEQDRAWLEQVLPCRPRYIGLLGARHRSALLVSEAAAAVGWTLRDACDHLFSPLGLDLGGDGAEAVALSAVAEIQACIQGKLPHSRRLTPEIVAEQIERGGASQFLQAQCAL